MDTDQSDRLRNDNPFRAPESNETSKRTASGGTLRLKIGLLVFAVAILLGPILSFIFIHSIIGSGVIVFSVGLTLIVGGKRNSVASVALLGGSGIAIVLFVFGLININDWSPDEATSPVSMLISAYSMFALPFAWFAYTRVVAMSAVETQNEHRDRQELVF